MKTFSISLFFYYTRVTTTLQFFDDDDDDTDDVGIVRSLLQKWQRQGAGKWLKEWRLSFICLTGMGMVGAQDVSFKEHCRIGYFFLYLEKSRDR